MALTTCNDMPKNSTGKFSAWQWMPRVIFTVFVGSIVSGVVSFVFLVVVVVVFVVEVHVLSECW